MELLSVLSGIPSASLVQKSHLGRLLLEHRHRQQSEIVFCWVGILNIVVVIFKTMILTEVLESIIIVTKRRNRKRSWGRWKVSCLNHLRSEHGQCICSFFECLDDGKTSVSSFRFTNVKLKFKHNLWRQSLVGFLCTTLLFELQLLLRFRLNRV